MEYVLVPLVALVASTLTLFSGFGLGTLLMPAFALFFPVDVAVALTAVVHGLNNVFKFGLLGKHADRGAVLRFGLPAMVAAVAGAWLLVRLADLPPLTTYHLGSRLLEVSPVKVVVAAIMASFAILEVLPGFERLEFHERYLPLGGLVSGFFGGLSGHQGALRSAFLVRAGLTKEAFVATGVVIAVLVDLSRLSVYAAQFAVAGLKENRLLLVVATAAAFAGAFVGKRLLGKVTLRSVQLVVAAMLIVIAVLLALGLA
ncbi:MAG: TSUP family transporter [Deltaproteobacteria bacterium]|nr:TSUP family transporter [Deltaproteobacteria bacterium]